jgi:hypothetical protein
MAIVNIDLPDHLKHLLESESRRRGLSQKVLVVLALEQYFDGKPSDRPDSVDGSEEGEVK